MRIAIPDFASQSKMIDWLIQNKSALVAQKKSVVKHADECSFVIEYISDKGEATKADAGPLPEGTTKIKVRSIINTTKIFDSHGDVHIDQLWNKSLKDSNDFYLVKEHNFSFDGIISDNVKAMAKQYTWLELGFNYEGKTQALVFDSIIDKNEDQTGMFDRYVKGQVKNHSVGMRYVKIDLAVNDERYEKEYAIWQKYFDDIVNKDDVTMAGYFWAVTEAKIIEGSAVVKGSNWATPTQSIQQAKTEPLKDTPGPVKSTLKASDLVKFYQPSKHI